MAGQEAGSLKLKVECDLWDSGEYIVSIRPLGGPASEGKPIGGTLDKSTATAVAKWLQESWPELSRVTSEMNPKSVAAPDLLEALTSFGVLSATPEWLAKRDAAIAKAKGVTS